MTHNESSLADGLCYII